MDEFVVVKYPEDRQVLINGHPSGRTNQTLNVEEGTHVFALGGAADFQPDSQEHFVSDTVPSQPFVVTFLPADEENEQ